MSITSSLRLCPPNISLSLHPNVHFCKSLVQLKPTFLRPSLFSSISIERLLTKAASTSSSGDSVHLQSVEDLPSKLQDIVKLFQSVDEPKAKYEQLLFYGRNLTPLEAKFKTKENKVQGCVSQVWVRAYLDSDKNVHFQADSDSVLTKGLAALLVQGLSGEPVSQILTVSPDFITLLGLQQSLTPSRNNGFLNMLKLMQNKAFLLYKKAEESGGVVNTEPSEVVDEGEELIENDGVEGNRMTEPDISTDDPNIDTGEVAGSKSNFGVSLGIRGEKIKEILASNLSPVELVVEDISHQHAGHAGIRGSAGETHFNVKIVSSLFEGKSSVKRHRLVYDLLQNELQSGLHALSILAKTPSEVNGR
ncbi:Sufe-like protein 1 protein [Thalictrum thalictroides]|uniref:Sufe-like protein 1 protein n=1 Tax=Thalictrum thalictroides TaxID=46969 RepID=A0A7J6WWP8_THATH|nr:Sufe-like protein 1 protein [Thalictrum thalictroides]